MTGRWGVRMVAAAAGCLFLTSSAGAWYPYSEKYTKWQQDRPISLTARHIRFPRDHYAERVARYRAAGFTEFFATRPTWGTPYLKAAHEALDRWGYGLSSVRFICGTQQIHKDLERKVSQFLGTEDTLLYAACFDANGGVFEPFLDQDCAVLTDALNHASLIDGIRLTKAVSKGKHQNSHHRGCSDGTQTAVTAARSH